MSKHRHGSADPNGEKRLPQNGYHPSSSKAEPPTPPIMRSLELMEFRYPVSALTVPQNEEMLFASPKEGNPKTRGPRRPSLELRTQDMADMLENGERRRHSIQSSTSSEEAQERLASNRSASSRASQQSTVLRGQRTANFSDVTNQTYGSETSRASRYSKEGILQLVKAQTRVQDGCEVYPMAIIVFAVLVAAACGVAAFALHLTVYFSGCLGGVNGCDRALILEVLEPLGISKSMYFMISCPLSALLCSCIIYSPWKGGVARNCLGGGSTGTKIAVSAGHQVSGWIVVLRIILAGLYMGGGSPLGTEGPVIHLGAELATYLISLSAWTRRRKILSMFGVIGAAAGISAGFGVLITGFIYTTEEVTRTLSRRLALILTLAALVAILVKHNLEALLEHWLHVHHVSLVPHPETLDRLTTHDIFVTLLLAIPIGILNGIAGWCFTQLAWALRCFLNPSPSQKHHVCRTFLPQRFHLAIIGVATGAFGVVAYESTGVNGVWGTTMGAIPETIAHGITWEGALLLFLMKFLSFTIATAGGGPGGMLVPSLVTGGFLGLGVALLAGSTDDVLSSACAVTGMSSLFASVMHLPVSGVIIIFELTESKAVILPVVLANFISANIAMRLPHGEHSFTHRMLEHHPLWEKLDKQDFIETDAHEQAAHYSTGYGKVKKELKFGLRSFYKAQFLRLSQAFQAWREHMEFVRFQSWRRQKTVTRSFSRDLTSGADMRPTRYPPRLRRSSTTQSRLSEISDGTSQVILARETLAACVSKALVAWRAALVTQQYRTALEQQAVQLACINVDLERLHKVCNPLKRQMSTFGLPGPEEEVNVDEVTSKHPRTPRPSAPVAMALTKCPGSAPAPSFPPPLLSLPSHSSLV